MSDNQQSSGALSTNLQAANGIVTTASQRIRPVLPGGTYDERIFDFLEGYVKILRDAGYQQTALDLSATFARGTDGIDVTMSLEVLKKNLLPKF